MRPDTGVLPRGGVIPAGTGPGLGPVTQGSEVCSPLSRFPCGRPGLCLPASFPYLPAGDNGGEGRGGGRPPPPPPAPPAPAPLAAPNPWALGIAAWSLAGAKGEVFFGSLAKGRARAVVSKAPPCPFGDGARVRRRILGRSSCAHGSEITRILVLLGRRLAKGTATSLRRCSAPQMGGCAKSREVSAVVLGGFGVGRAEREKRGRENIGVGSLVPITVLPHASSAALPTLTRTRRAGGLVGRVPVPRYGFAEHQEKPKWEGNKTKGQRKCNSLPWLGLATVP